MMSNASKPKVRWLSLMLAFVVGCLVGLTSGILIASLFAWAYVTVETEAALEPLADLKIDKERLTVEEAQVYIDKLAAEYLSSGPHAGLVIGIVKEGNQHVYGYGTIERGKSQAPDGDTVFELASVGKTFTATVLGQMHLQKELDWHSPIASVLPKSTQAPSFGGRDITLLDLATQTSGLPSLPGNFTPKDPLNPYADYAVEDMYRGLAEIELPRPPGKKYEYSNLGFGLLGHILELKANTTYEELIVNRLCDPLGMDSTRMTLDESIKSRLAIPHDNGKPVPVWEDRTMAGAGSFLSTAGDMLKYVEAHLTDGNGTLREATRTTIQKRQPTDSPATAIGLAWHIDSENAIDIIWHNGGSGGSSSYVALLTPSKIGVVVLSNSSASVDEIGRKVLYLLYLH